MPARARPVLNYASMTEAVVDLRRKGQTTREIAEQVGCSTGTVTSLEAMHRKGKAFRQSIPPVGAIRMCKISDFFAEHHLAPLRPHAERRGMSVDMLIKTLVRQAAESSLVDAVLDDGGEL